MGSSAGKRVHRVVEGDVNANHRIRDVKHCVLDVSDVVVGISIALHAPIMSIGCHV